MGIKGLWTILTPFCDRKPLYELQGKTVAVDLSCWICEAQNIAEYEVQPRMYLRNLYFRTCFLLLMGINPVFVLEGQAPELKFDTIAARNAIQFKGAKPKKDGEKKAGKGRSRFNFVLKQCEEMLGFMGLVCIKGKGEAESLCAYLNEDDLVAGCISQDSDCFAYGAKVVYRNFSISQQGAQASSGGAIDVYDIAKVNKSMKFGRNKIIALALLCGSDYSEGVFGVGKESVMKLFENISDEETLDLLRSWREKVDVYEKLEQKVADKTRCASCGHLGKQNSHTRIGCMQCGTSKGCDTQYKEEIKVIKNELNIRSKAIQDPDFPNEALIKEFLHRKDNVSKLNLKWSQPNMKAFIKFTTKFLDWEELYAFQKFLPIFTRWQVLNPTQIQQAEEILFPGRIKKVRNPKGVPSYEIIWTDKNNCFDNLIPKSQLEDETVDIEKLWSTIEPQTFVENAYPQLVQEFLQSKVKPKKQGKRKKKTTEIDELDELLKNTSISEPAPKKTRKPRAPKKKENKKIEDLENSFNELSIKPNKAAIKPIDSYFKKAITNLQKQNCKDKEFVVENCSSSTPIKLNVGKADKSNVSFDLDLSNFGDENDCNISDLIDNMVSQKIPNIVENRLKNMGFKICQFKETKCELNSSSFFVSNPVEDDMFEKTFNQHLVQNSSGEETEEYEFDEEEFKGKLNATEDVVYKFCQKQLNCEENLLQNVGNQDEECDKIESDNDSFSITYVPLIERLRRK